MFGSCLTLSTSRTLQSSLESGDAAKVDVLIEQINTEAVYRKKFIYVQRKSKAYSTLPDNVTHPS